MLVTVCAYISVYEFKCDKYVQAVISCWKTKSLKESNMELL